VLPFVPVCVQAPLARKVTGLPEPPPVALTTKSALPKVLFAREAKSIAWSPFAIVILRLVVVAPGDTPLLAMTFMPV
jgi:hypothetical protein